MLLFVARRLVSMLFVMFSISVLVFVIFFATPGVDPAARIAGRNADQATLAAVRKDFGLDKPLPVQYWTFLTNAFTGEFGRSFASNVPAIDLILQRTTTWRPILRAMAAGLAFLVVFIAAQWPFASFLMTPLARNWVFGTDYMDFSTPAWSLYARFLFIPPEAALQFWRGMFVATITSCLMVWLGIHTGRAMQKVQR